MCMVFTLLLPLTSAFCKSDSECTAPQRCLDCTDVGFAGENCCLYVLCTSDAECLNGQYCTDDGVCHLKANIVEGVIMPLDPGMGDAEPTPDAPQDMNFIYLGIVALLVIIILVLALKKK